MTSTRRHPPHDLGRWGEAEAERALVAADWHVLARNYRFGRREVDLVVRRADTVAFVEVKTRAGGRFGAPEEAVTKLKRREIECVAEHFLARHPQGDVDIRFDVIAIVVGPGRCVRRMSHLEGAWRPDSR